MNRKVMLMALSMATLGVFTMTATRAQPADAPTTAPQTGPAGEAPAGPPRDRPGDWPDFGDRGPRDGPREGRDGPREGRDGPPGMGRPSLGPGGPGGPGGLGGAMIRRPPSVDVMRNYLELVTRYTEISKDPTTAGVSAVITAADLLRARGPEAAIAYFEKNLPDVKDASVARAIRLQLAELYKANGQTDKALEQLSEVMKGS